MAEYKVGYFVGSLGHWFDQSPARQGASVASAAVVEAGAVGSDAEARRVKINKQ